jgi:hypothetical protein
MQSKLYKDEYQFAAKSKGKFITFICSILLKRNTLIGHSSTAKPKKILSGQFLHIVFQEMKGFGHVEQSPPQHPRENSRLIYRRYDTNLSQKYEKYFSKAIYILLMKNSW